MKDKYKVRQAIIDYLFSKVTYDEIDIPHLGDTRMPLTEIAENIGYDYEDVFMAHHGIPDEQAICVHGEPVHTMMLKREGITASIDKYWLREGEKESNERIFDKTKWVIPLLALLATLITLAISVIKISSIQREVTRLSTEISALKAQKK